MKLVVVESPTKAKTIRKFLGKDFVVESCMGHIRDLPQSAREIPEKFKKEKWAKLGVDVENDFEPLYCVPKNKTKVVTNLRSKLKEADELILATDEDREGESISWHLVEVLKPKIPTKRMVFHEITKEAIKASLDDFRDIDYNLVRAQEARRILDRLVGYTISPLIWKKIAYGLSAGRVQSVAVRLVTEREHERIRFKKAEYWSLLGKMKKEGSEFEAKLLRFDSQRVATGKDFDAETGELLAEKSKDTLHIKQVQAQKIAADLQGQSWKVEEVEEKPVSRRPAPPFITSTLQQEANRKLGFGSKHTMRVAQRLYEQGMITYMRTDSTFLSDQAIVAARHCIEDLYGKNYLPAQPRNYSKKKVKGAQEAHEAIRPAGTHFVRPEDSGLRDDELKVYDLIWKRTVASQMVNAEQKHVHVKLGVGAALFTASGMTITFPGFLRAYVEGRDDAEAALEDREVHLPALKQGDSVDCREVKPTQHETKPPARFTEASLVQVLEKEGIGRPSTYASIMGTIIDRGYVRKVGNALVPTFTALVVTKLLRSYLPEYVDSGFTSAMEQSLDEIAEGDLEWKRYLHQIYFGDKGLKSQVETQEKNIEPEEARSIRLEGFKGYDFRVGRYGAYVCKDNDGEEVCASIPENRSPGEIDTETIDKLIDQKINGADALGKDPETDLPIYVLTGRYGPYVQLGDSEAEKTKPKRASIPPGYDPDNLTLPQALDLLSLPKTLGQHPETEKDIKVGYGRFGPYVVHDGDFRSIPKNEDMFQVDYERAMELLSQPKKGRRRSTAIQDLGEFPEGGEALSVMTGRYGPYIKWGKKNISLPDDVNAEKVSKEDVLKIIREKVGEDEIKAAATGKKAKKAKTKAKKTKTAKKKTKAKSKSASKKTKKKVAKSSAKTKKKA